MPKKNVPTSTQAPYFHSFSRESVHQDFYYSCLSRELSRLLRREVLTGKAKFGAGSAGKELPQVVVARVFEPGDFYSGYYRDQSFMLAKELATPQQFFTMLYGDADREAFSGGRQMINHYSTPLVDAEGNWLELKEQLNVAASLSPVAGQITHAIGIAAASKAYRQNSRLSTQTPFSNNGREVSFCISGDAAAAEGIFFEAINAAGVMQIPLAFVILDDGYGISVPTEYQVTKGNISKILEGFRRKEGENGIDLYTLKAWDYAGLRETVEKGIQQMRETHVPAVFHIEDCTQPFGHSTSGSHERYKSKERLEWEAEWDCVRKMEAWMLENELASETETAAIRETAIRDAKAGRKQAWELFRKPIEAERKQLIHIFSHIKKQHPPSENIRQLGQELRQLMNPVLSELLKVARRMQMATLGSSSVARTELEAWIKATFELAHRRYHTHLYSETPRSALKVEEVPARYEPDAPLVNGFEVLNAYFDKVLDQYPHLYAFGEDVGKIGDVNQAFAGLQAKYGESRVFDTGIREWTIVGQAMGMAMRGLRAIGEIQYLDYIHYAIAPLSDDLASLRYRTNGQQIAPAIIRTRGHRLEGIWHSGSPIGMLLHALRGIYLLVPRNMTQAAGMYQTMLQSDDPALIIECLNGYRLKERLPANLGEFTVPLGMPEILQQGTDVSLLTYGSCVRVAQEGIALLQQHGISVELIDVQTLLPFDLEHRIVQSLKKTNRVLFMDEDVPGGASAYMMQQVLEVQGGYRYLDSPPVTLTAAPHRPPFADDGDYFSKPSAEDVFQAVYELMNEAEPGRFPL